MVRNRFGRDAARAVVLRPGMCCSLALGLTLAAAPLQALDLGGVSVDVGVGIGGGGAGVGATVGLGGSGSSGGGVTAGVGVGLGGGSGVGVGVGVGIGGGGTGGGGTGGGGTGTGGGTGGGGTGGGGAGGGTGGGTGVGGGTGGGAGIIAAATGKMPCAGGGNATAFNGFPVRDRNGEVIGWVNDTTLGADQSIREIRLQSTDRGCYSLVGGSYRLKGGEVWVNIDGAKLR